MLKTDFKQVTTAFVGGVASVAIVSAIAPQAAPAATFYTSTFSVEGTQGPADYVPLVASTVTYTKEALPNGLFGYKLLTATSSVLGQNYSLGALAPFTSYLSLLGAIVPDPYQVEFQSLVTNYQSIFTNLSDPNAQYTYIGDGGFPPPDYTFTFSETDLGDLSSVALVALYFPNGGKMSFTSTLPDPVLPDPGQVSDPDDSPISEPKPDNASAVPEPTTVIGLGLAAGGWFAARRRKQMQP